MDLLRILRESLKLPFTNGKKNLFLSITLLLLIPSSILFFSNHFALKPFIIDFSMKVFLLPDMYPDTPEYTELLDAIAKDVRILIGEETIFILASSAISFFTTVAMIYASAMSYCKEESMTLKELFSNVRRMWKRGAITWSYVALFNLFYLIVGVVLIGALVVIAKEQTGLLIGLGSLMGVCFLLMYIYLSMVWRLGLVVSVVEEGCYGMGAIWKAGELMKGRKLQGFFLSLVITVVGIVVSGVLCFEMGVVGRTEATQLVFGFVLIIATCIEELFIAGVWTVFYCECKKENGEKVEIEREGRAGYSLISTTCHVDTSIL